MIKTTSDKQRNTKTTKKKESRFAANRNELKIDKQTSKRRAWVFRCMDVPLVVKKCRYLALQLRRLQKEGVDDTKEKYFPNVKTINIKE